MRLAPCCCFFNSHFRQSRFNGFGHSPHGFNFIDVLPCFSDEFVSKGFSRIDVQTNGSRPADTLAGHFRGLPLRVNDNFNVPAESYAYDSVGNRTSSHLAAGYSYDQGNRLTTDGVFAYIYDANGNMIRKTETATGLVTAYSYDSENRIVRIDLPGGGAATYAYDAMGRRVRKDVNGLPAD